MGDRSPMDVQDGAPLPTPPTDDKSEAGGGATLISPPLPGDESTGEEGAKRMRTATGAGGVVSSESSSCSLKSAASSATEATVVSVVSLQSSSSSASTLSAMASAQGGAGAASSSASWADVGAPAPMISGADEATIELIAKWRGEEIELGAIPMSCTITHVKMLLQTRTHVHPSKQKLIGLGKGKFTDETELNALTFNKAPFRFIFMGTPEEEVFVDPADKEDLPEVFDDLDMDASCFSDEWRRSVQNSDNLKKFTASTEVHLIHPPRPGKRLLVLDLDHTLLDFSDRERGLAMGMPVGRMKRPHLDAFLTAVYEHFDLVVWSQTSWRWLEVKMSELGMLSSRSFRFCFVLDKTSMFKVESFKPDGTLRKHQVKPLQIIWSKFPHQWSAANTVHIDDLSRNFALNQGNGIKVRAFYRDEPEAAQDDELLLLAQYLNSLTNCEDLIVIINGEIVPDDDPRAKARRNSSAPPAGGPTVSSSSSFQGNAYTTSGGLQAQAPAPASRPPPSAAAPPNTPLDYAADALGVRGKTIRIPPIPAPLNVPEAEVEVIYLVVLALAALYFGWRLLVVVAIMHVILGKNKQRQQTGSSAASGSSARPPAPAPTQRRGIATLHDSKAD